MFPYGHYSTNLEVARQKIDEDICALKAQIRALKTTRNTFSVFSRLHPEVVEEIFLLISRNTYQGNGKGVLRLTWVCHQWRETVHQSSALWTHIDFLEPAWLESALPRAHGRKLSFFVTFEPGSYMESASLVMKHATQVTIFNATRSTLTGTVDSNPFWKTSYPALVSLSLEDLSLPTTLSPKAFPALEELELRGGCKFTWDTLPLHHGLKRLVICCPSEKTSVEFLVEAFRIMQDTLEVVQLNKTLRFASSFAEPVDLPFKPRQYLPKLRSFSLDDRNLELCIAFLLNRLSFPADIRDIKISVESETHHLELIRGLVSCCGLQIWPINYVELHLTDHGIKLHMKEGWTPPKEVVRPGAGKRGTYVVSRDDIGAERKCISIHLDIDDMRDEVTAFDVLPISLTNGYVTFSGQCDYRQGISGLVDSVTRGDVNHLRISRDFFETFTSIIHKQNVKLQKDIGAVSQMKHDEIDNHTKAQILNILSFHQLTTLHYDAKYSTEQAFDPKIFKILRRWLTWRHLVGLGVKSLRFKAITVLSGTDLPAMYAGIVGRLECFETFELQAEGRTYVQAIKLLSDP